MSALSVRLPESLHKYARQYAAHEGISVNQLISTALAGLLLLWGARSPLLAIGALALTCAAIDDVTAWCALAAVVAERAAGVVLVHNHPSGDPSPSAERIDESELLLRPL